MTSHEAFYLPLDGAEGERFHATGATEGPWFPDTQHVGPPTAMLVRAVQRCAPRPELELSRFTVEVLGPVPTGEVTVRAAVERGGRAIELVGAEVVADGRAVLRARAWRTARSDTTAVANPPPPLAPPPDGLAVQSPLPPQWSCGYIDSVEWRWIRGGWTEPGDGTVWARPRLPLVAGEETGAVPQLAVVADSGNGISGRVDLREWLYVNTELTIHLHRQPSGPWVGVDARTMIGPAGAGTAVAALYDLAGQVGQGTQALFLRRR